MGDRHYLVPPLRLGAAIRPQLAHIPLWYWGTPGTGTAGWIGPVPILNIGSPPVVGADGGWISPIPTLNLGGDTLVTQAGYYSIIPPIPLGGDGTVVADEGGRRRRTYFTYIGRPRLGR